MSDFEILQQLLKDRHIDFETKLITNRGNVILVGDYDQVLFKFDEDNKLVTIEVRRETDPREH